MPRKSLKTKSVDTIRFLPLGGTNEIGMNLSLYEHGGKWLMVDLGIAFGDESTPGVEILMADPTYAEERRHDLVGLILTHAHEDHVGAVEHLWDRLRCPIYATPFTAAFLRLKLKESEIADEVEIREVPLGGRLRLEPFDIEFVTMTHSIPEPNALAIRTPAGLIVHTGDWKIDPSPPIGELTDEARLKELGDEGVLAVVCDSTNVFEREHSGSESDAKAGLAQVIAAQTGRVAVTLFSSNVARIKSIAEVAHDCGRHCAIVGRSIWRIHDAAKASGYLSDLPAEFVSERDAGFLPRDRIVLIVAGSQGEPRSALTRVAHDEHPHITLERGDTVVYSAREIPGNEKPIGRVQDALIARGITVITPDEAPVHVSGHPARAELTELYRWLRPRIVVPVHGTRRHLREHARLAQSCQVPMTVIPEDGSIVEIGPGGARIVETISVGRLGVDGDRLIRLDGETIRERSRMVWNGAAVATLVVDGRGDLVEDPMVTLLGLEDEEELDETVEAVVEELRELVEGLPLQRRRNDAEIREAARITVRRAIKSWTGKKPVTQVHLVRV